MNTFREDRQEVMGRTGLNALNAAEDSVVTFPEKLQIQSLKRAPAARHSFQEEVGELVWGQTPGAPAVPHGAVSLKLHSTLENADISQCPGHTQTNYIRIPENGTQDSGFLKLPSYIHWAAQVENHWSRGHSSFGLRAGVESACFLRAALTSWSVGGPPWICPLTWAFSTWKDGPASGTTHVPVFLSPPSLPIPTAPGVIFLRINANCVIPAPSPCRPSTGHGDTSEISPCFSF